MKRKLWNDSLSVALATRVLAEQQGIDWYRAFTAGMLSNIGILAVSRCFLQNLTNFIIKKLNKLMTTVISVYTMLLSR